MASILVLKCVLYSLNVLFLCLGCFFMYVGVYMASDEEIVNYGWLLPMKFRMPLVYYAMFGVTLTGVVFCAVSILGFFSVTTSSKILFSAYIFVLAVLLISETAALISASLTPDSLGLRPDPEATTDSWQRTYAVPGKEQYTAAIDYIQTNGECCGSESFKEWTTSWWRLRDYAPEGLVVPLSCCVRNLSSFEETNVILRPHLDPSPMNASACQSQDEDVYSVARHTQGCSTILEIWTNDNLRKVLFASVSTIFYQLCMLLAAICGAFHIFTKTDQRTL